MGWAAAGIWMVMLSAYDIGQRRLPNWLTLSGAAVIVSVAAVCGHGRSAVVGAVALGGLYLAIHLIDPRALGGGDVKLALGLGALTAVFGADVWVLAALGAPALSAIGAVTVLLRGGGRAVPHGPSMCAASAAAVLAAVG